MADMYRLLSILLAMCLLATVPGCWDKQEIEDLGIVQAIAVDKREGSETGIRLLIQIINPKAIAGGGGGGGGGMAQAGGGKPNTFRNFSIEGESMLEAARKLTLISPRRLFYAHTQVIVVNEKLARERNIMEILDFLDRSPQIRRQAWFLIAREDINEIFNENPPLANTSAMQIADVIKERKLTSQYGAKQLGEFLKDLQAEGREPFTAGIELIRSQALPRKVNPTGELEQEIMLTDTAVFTKNRLAGWLNQKETRGLLWIRNEVEGGAIIIPCPGKENQKISLDILRAKTKVTPRINDGQVKMVVEVTEQSNIDEVTCPVELNKPEVISRIEELQNRAIAGEIRAALEMAQTELEVDVFGFGRSLFQHEPALWRQIKGEWDDIFPYVDVEIVVNSQVRRTGLVVTPARPVD